MTSETPIRIDWAQPDDMAPLAPLWRTLSAHDVPDAPQPDDATLGRHLALLLAPDTPHQLAIAWNADGVAIGLAAVAIFISVSDPRPERWRQMELKELFVLPKYRSFGVGAALMDWVASQAESEGACRVDWHVKRDNVRGIAFYERHGAEIVENRLSMRKPLS